MKKSWNVAIGIVILLAISMITLTLLKPENRIENSEEYQHQLEADANPEIGPMTLAENFVLDESFVTHLPLVIIDFQGNELRNIYRFTLDGIGRTYTEEGWKDPNPWSHMSISIIDNDNHENHITDTAVLSNEGLIKLRGMTSRSYPKKQYGIKFMSGDEEAELAVLGMEADEDWVLSNSFTDMSGIRNYLAMNIGRQIFPYTSEVRFCEVVFKDGDTYTYQGLYLLEEKIKQGKGRVDIADYEEDAASLSYIVCRDRYNETKLTLSTWASDQQRCYGYFTMVYPKEDFLSEEAINTIEEELSRIEYCLYSDDAQEFKKYKNYLDVDSFVDYFLFNEFFMNYDSGNNSTYYYKNKDGKLAVGPIWDYDGGLDNYISAASSLEYAVFVERPWFERLIMDSEFRNKLNARYKELRKGYLNEEYIYTFIDDTMAYLGNASIRNDFRWRAEYESGWELQTLENGEGVLVERRRDTVEGEVLRIKDIIKIHGLWMDEELKELLIKRSNEQFSKMRRKDMNWIAMGAIYIFVLMVVVLMRVVKGEYK